MNRDTLIQVFKNSYKRQVFIEHCLLPLVQNKVDDLIIYDEQTVQEIQLTATDQNYATSVIKYGEFKTRDELPRTVELYEVTVNNDRQIERSRVGLGALIKKHIIGHNAVMVNFTYENQENRSWRFSFIARDSIFQDGEMTITETNPKRYTYVFGQPEETYKTAMDRFMALANEFKITIHKIKEAFSVEKMSKQFFDDYRDVHYAGFVDYLMRSNFYKSTFNGNDKEVRNFVKKLLGRIVFLYFLQKKGWLGAKDTAYKDGDRNFMHHFFEKAGANDAFYSTWLTRLFFDTLNQKRPNDDFEMPDGETLKVPYLNGGLFEKDASKYDYLVFPADYFENLFAFFNQYNFTIYEDGPENQTLAVDPEMLGHIFENLLEDNKDKGAFYTPKEIVHYMTQESLIEYLCTHLPKAPKEEIDQFIKNKEHRLTNEDKKQIDQKLDDIKICDPAIGSGAFPMGLLQEIFSIKERIAYDLGYKVWSPATVKENIIQNSIYGVDIEAGAVDIARLRFWLSLIVDEDQPKVLPNLDYKIVVGNSLVSKFEDEVIEIDWNTDTTSGGLFSQDIIAQKTKLLQKISEKQKVFFTADSKDKPQFTKEIRGLKLDILEKQLELMIENGFIEDKNAVEKLSKKQLEKKMETEGWKRTLKKIRYFKNNDEPFKHFDWKLDFPEVLNSLVNESTGFDIVIGNPPYRQIKWLDDKKILKEKKFKSFVSSGDIYCLFYEQSNNLLKENGLGTFITSNKWLRSSYGKRLRNLFIIYANPIQLIDFGGNKIFDTATVDTNILFWKKAEYNHKTQSILIDENFNKKYSVDRYINHNLKAYNFLKNCSWLLLTDSELKLKTELERKYLPIKKHNINLNYGILTGANPAFIINVSTRNQLIKSDSKNKELIKPIIRGKDLGNFFFDFNDFYLLNIHNGTETKKRVDIIKNYPSLIPYLKSFGDKFKNRGEQGKEWYNLRSCTYLDEFEKNKIIYADIVQKRGKFYFDDEGYYTNDTAFIITGENLKANTAIFNSKLFSFLYKKFYSGGGLGNKGLRFKKEFIEKIPLPILNEIIRKDFQNMTSIIQKIYKISKNIDSTVPNNHIAESFEEVVDALVFELYFPEEFAEKGIEIEKYAQAIFKPIESLSEEEQIAAIREAYQNLRKADNPLRNQIKLMKIELKELLLPILSL